MWFVLAVRLFIDEILNIRKVNRAIIFVRYGSTVKPYIASRREQEGDENVDEYKYRDGSVVVPKDDWTWIGGHRLIAVEDGKFVAGSFKGNQLALPMNVLSRWLESDHTGKAIRSLSGGLNLNYKWILIIAVVVGIAYVIYKQYGGIDIGNEPVVLPTPTMPPFVK